MSKRDFMLLLNNEIKFMIKRNCSAMFVGV